MTTYVDNSLNSYDNYTYNWKIKMVDLSSPGLTNGVVLAQSGVENEISIEGVTHEFRLAFVEANRSGTSNYFTVNLKEPNALSLFTRIKAASTILNIPNHLEAGYELSLTITGREPDLNSTPNNNIFNARWITKCYGIDHDFSGTESNYIMAFIEQPDTAYELQDFQFGADISVSASNLGDFARELQYRLNEESETLTNLNKNKIFPTKYVIEFPGMDSYVFASQVNDSQAGGRYVSTNGDGTLNFEFPSGTQITQMMAVAALHTIHWQRVPTSTGGYIFPEDGRASADPSQLAQLALWFRFEPSTELGRYDSLARQYERTITFRMITYISPEMVADVISHTELTENSRLQETRIQRIISENLIRKRYDYFFTGLNTEVLDASFKLNSAYYSLSSMAQGNNSDTRFPYGIPSDNNEIIDLTEQISNLEQQRQEAIDLREQTAEQGVNIGASITNLIASLGEQIESATEQLESLVDTQSEPALQTLTSDRYLTQSDLSRESRDPYVSALKFSYEPFNSLATNGPDNGVDGDPAAVRLGVIEQSMNSLRDLLNLDLVVRGDPYWLGVEHDDFISGGPSFFLNVKIPTYDENSDITATTSTDWSLTGLYRVIMVISRFESGQWTMTLGSYRDNVTNAQLVYEDLLEGIQRSDEEIRVLQLDDIDAEREEEAFNVGLTDEATQELIDEGVILPSRPN